MSVFLEIVMRAVRPLQISGLAGAVCVLVAIASAQEPNQLPDSSASKYVGAEVCQGCHEDAYKTFAASKHVKTLQRPKISEQGCEGCHGPGAEHAEAGDPDKILRFPSASPAAIRQTCTVCHQAKLGPAHDKAGLTCLTCHSVHHYMEREFILVVPTVQLCRRCHKF